MPLNNHPLSLLNSKAIADRRNPLSKQQQKRATLELKLHRDTLAKTIPNQIYEWAYLDDAGVEHIVYIGKAEDPERRFANHRRAIKLGMDLTEKYEQARFLKKELIMRVVDPEGEFSENEWMAIFREQGQTLWNDIAGIEKKRSKPKTTLTPAPVTLSRDAHNLAQLAISGKFNWKR